VLKKIKAEKVKEVATPASLTVYVRASDGAKWRDVVVNLLQGYAELPTDKGWTLDVSKYFYVDKGDVKYLWRLVFRGEHYIDGVAVFTNCVMEIVRANAKELDSFPLSEGSTTFPTQQVDVSRVPTELRTPE
jgi:hypothetical protein